MISENQLRELLALRTETKNLDCKESLNWDKANNDAKCELVKDVLALLNTQDGGHIVFGVRDSTLDLIGLSQEDWMSFDPTKVNDFLQRYTDPVASCEVQKLVVDGLSVVVISVSEFKDIPIICKKDANSSKESSKLLLKAGGLYMRTEKATSILVPTSEEMRDLLNRALLKRGDQLLNTIETLLRGKPASEESELQRYSKEIAAAQEWLKQVLPADFEKRGYWRLMSMPKTYVPERIQNITTILKVLLESKVSLRGWDFPHFDKDNRSNFSDGTQSYTELSRYVEGFRAYQSGFFIWQGAYRENDPEFARNAGKSLAFVNVIYEVTEMFVFLKRFYERASPQATLHFSLHLTDIKGRALIAVNLDDAQFLGGSHSKESELLIEREYTVSELRADAEELAIKVVQKVFEVFNWNNPDPNMIRGWQQRLLSRTL